MNDNAIDKFESFEEFKQYCLKHRSQIFVRAMVQGKIRTVSLDELSKVERNDMIDNWWKLRLKDNDDAT